MRRVKPAFESTLTVHDRGEGEGDSPRLSPHLFLAFECARPAALSVRYSLESIDAVVIGRGRDRGAELYTEAGQRTLSIRVPDLRMSSSHARLERGFGQWVIRDAGSKNGSLVNGVLTDRVVLADGDLIELGYTLFQFRQALPVHGERPVVDAAQLAPPAPGLVTLSPRLAVDVERLAQIAPSAVTVLLTGETGTGKEVLARAIHRLSGRGGDLVAVNCGALPDEIIESELFGHRRGAFSGAVDDKVGLIRSADGGTLLLDEIGDLPLPSQAAFLRVLQEREVVPVGGARPVKVDIRLIAATHRDLGGLASAGQFRDDLLARISGFRLHLPPLRERCEDLGLLIGSLLRRIAGEAADHLSFTKEAARALYTYDWPQNVRELEQCLAAAVVLAGGQPIDVDHLPQPVRDGPAGERDTIDDGDEDARRRAELVELLREHAGNISAVARAMGKARMQIHRWIRRYGLQLEDYR